MTKLKYAYYKFGEGWTDIEPLDLKKGMMFRIFENSNVYFFEAGTRTFIVDKDPQLTQEGVVDLIYHGFYI